MPVALACGMIFISNFSTPALVFICCLVMLYVGRVKGHELWRLVRTVILAVVVMVTVMYMFDLGRSTEWINRLKNFVGIENIEGMTEREKEAKARNESQVENAKMAIA